MCRLHQDLEAYCRQKAEDLKDMSLKTQVADHDIALCVSTQHAVPGLQKTHVVCVQDTNERFARVQQEMQRLCEDAPRM
jgi:hypothetical protein